MPIPLAATGVAQFLKAVPLWALLIGPAAGAEGVSPASLSPHATDALLERLSRVVAAPYPGPVELVLPATTPAAEAVSFAETLFIRGWPVVSQRRGLSDRAPATDEVRFLGADGSDDAIRLARTLTELRPGAEVLIRPLDDPDRPAGTLEIRLAPQ